MDALEKQMGKMKGRLENRGNTATKGGLMINAPTVGELNYAETVEKKVVEKMATEHNGTKIV
jgi:hypothetical protein